MSFRTSVAQPAPTNGVSQQAAHLRLPTHAAGMVNAWPDVALGVYKRPGTEIDRKFTDTPHLTPKLKVLTYAADEQYIVLWNGAAAAPVRIFRVGGNEASVSISSDAVTYMTSGSGVCRLCPLGDFAAIINPDVATAVAAASSYSLERARPEYRDLLAYTTTSGNYLKTDADSTAQKAGYFTYSPGSVTYSLTNFLTLTTPWSYFDGYWNDGTNFPCGFNVAFRRVTLAGFTGAAYTFADGKITKTDAFLNYTWRAGDMIQLSAGTGFTANNWYVITSRFDKDTIVVSGGPGADNANTASNYTDATYGETNALRIGIQAEAIINTSTMEPAPTSMHDIAAEFQKRIRETAGLEYALVAWVPQLGGGNFQITGFRGTGGVVYAPTAPAALKVGATGDLTAATYPFYNTPLQVFGGTGTATSPWDSPESRWTRVAAPGQSGAVLDPATMPVVLLRTAANTFTVGRPTWTPRGVGDSTSNPAPKLVTTGSKITSAVRHRNRVFCTGGPYIMGSQLGNDYNFFNTDTPDVVDTDPIDRTISGENNADIRQVAAFRDGLVLFTSSGLQLEMTSGETMTPKTVSITPTTRAAFVDCPPAIASPALFFASPQGQYSGVREYVYDFARGSSQLSDITVVVPAYISGTVTDLAISGEQRTVVALAGSRNKLWCYRWFYDGDNKLQSAWNRWEYDSGYSITGIDCVGGVLWLVNENTATVTTAAGSPTTVTFNNHGLSTGNSVVLAESATSALNGTFVVTVLDTNTFTIPVVTAAAGSATAFTGAYFIEKATLGLQSPVTGDAYEVHMDRKLRLAGVHSAGTTTFTLPATPTVLGGGSSQISGYGSTLNKVVTPTGTVYDVASYTATTVTVTGDLSGGTCTLGRWFAWSVDMTRPYVRTDSNALVQDPLFIETASFAFANTMNMTVTEGTRTRTTTQTSPTSGVITTLLGGKAGSISHSVSDSNPGPTGLTGMEYDIDHAPIGVVPQGRN